jgi:hypothetical protein
MWNVWGGKLMPIALWWEIRREETTRNTHVSGRIILKWILDWMGWY